METRVNPVLSLALAVRDRARALTSHDPEVEEPEGEGSETRAWARNLGTAALIGSLGIALAGAVSTAGTAVNTSEPDQPSVQISVDTNVRQPDQFGQRQGQTSRSAAREAVDNREAQAQDRRRKISQIQTRVAAKERSSELGQEAEAAKKNQERLNSRVPSVWPLASYTLRARWGEYGPWAKYHTGVDLSAPLGSEIVAPAPGVVEHAGPGGEAGSWAGCYVVIRHNDGQATLYAHMSCGLSVSVGQTVAAGTRLGQVGMTGRSFGPHLHLELYPAGAVPGKIYTSIDPLPWLNQID